MGSATLGDTVVCKQSQVVNDGGYPESQGHFQEITFQFSKTRSCKIYQFRMVRENNVWSEMC